MAPEALRIMQEYAWPGNVRELEHDMQRAVIVCRGEEIQDRDILLGLGDTCGQPIEGQSQALVTLEALERRHICRVLEQTKWVIGGTSGAAAVLGLNESTLRGRMRKLNIRRP